MPKISTRDALMEFYQAVDPTKVNMVPFLTKTYTGDEKRLLVAMREKYKGNDEVLERIDGMERTLLGGGDDGASPLEVDVDIESPTAKGSKRKSRGRRARSKSPVR